MFTFVYLWTPTLSAGGTAAPLGIIVALAQRSIVQYSLVWVHYSAGQNSAVEESAIQCSTLQCCTVQCSTV